MTTGISPEAQKTILEHLDKIETGVVELQTSMKQFRAGLDTYETCSLIGGNDVAVKTVRQIIREFDERFDLKD